MSTLQMVTCICYLVISVAFFLAGELGAAVGMLILHKLTLDEVK